MIGAIRRLRLEWTGLDRVWIAPPVQQEVLVLHIRKTFRVESHADKMEIVVEPVDLDGILDIVVRRAVTIVVSVVAGCCPTVRSRNNGWQGIAAQNIGGGKASRARIVFLGQKGVVEAAAD